MVRLSTDDLSPKERFPFWREVFGRSIIRLDFEMVNEKPFSAAAALHSFDDLGIALGSTDGLRARRTRPLMEDGSDDLIVHVSLSSYSLCSHRDQQVRVEAGAAVLMTAAEAGEHLCPEPARILNLRIPRRIMARYDPHPETVVMRLVPPGTEALRLLIDYVAAAERHEMSEPGLRKAFCTHVHDLIGLAMGGPRIQRELVGSRGLRAARLGAIKKDIDAHLSDERLTITEVAHRHRLSPRSVQLLFEEQGITFSEYLVGQRLARAHDMLVMAEYMDRTIAAIAYEVGFANLSYFNRTFRRRYGATPSEIREMKRPDRF